MLKLIITMPINKMVNVFNNFVMHALMPFGTGHNDKDAAALAWVQ